MDPRHTVAGDNYVISTEAVSNHPVTGLRSRILDYNDYRAACPDMVKQALIRQSRRFDRNAALTKRLTQNDG